VLKKKGEWRSAYEGHDWGRKGGQQRKRNAVLGRRKVKGNKFDYLQAGLTRHKRRGKVGGSEPERRKRPRSKIRWTQESKLGSGWAGHARREDYCFNRAALGQKCREQPSNGVVKVN